MDRDLYQLENTETLATPALVYYREYIEANTRKAIAVAGDAQRLWPHVKSHKMREMVRMQQRMGIERFKCATIAEAQMVAECGVDHIIVAYPLVGPNIARFMKLCNAYPNTGFYAIGDDLEQLSLLAAASVAAGVVTAVLLDVNMGMNRTGVPLDGVVPMYLACAKLEGLEMLGLHCYDGHVNQPQYTDRVAAAQGAVEKLRAIDRELRAQGAACDLHVMGGTPSFPVHATDPSVYLSPGTVFLGDAKTMRNISDLSVMPAAGIMARVVSHPAESLFTIDLGSKGISTDQREGPGVIISLPEAEPLFQSEEHWVFRMPADAQRPAIGTVLFVLPMHICPTTALYPYAHIAVGGRIVDRWVVAARDRDIGI